MMVGLNTEYFTDSAPPLELADSKPSYVNSGVENIRNCMITRYSCRTVKTGTLWILVGYAHC